MQQIIEQRAKERVEVDELELGDDDQPREEAEVY
jgi:hypothetical protein